MKTTLILLCLVLLSGCDSKTQEQYQADMRRQQTLRQAIFKDCLARIPKGPERTHYNDWSEVVAQCDDIAYWQSQGM